MKKNATILKMSFTVLLCAALMSACTQKGNNGNDTQTDNSENSENALTQAEKEEGWKLLFDGKSMENFKGFRKDEVPSAWQVENGTIAFAAGGQGGDLITKEQYKDFEFSIDWKISEGGNSGIMYHVSEDTTYRNTYNSGPEMQILDDERHPDAKQGKDGNRQAGALYDLIPLSTPAVKPAGQWNTARLLVKDGHVEHWLNGKKVVEYEIGSPEWDSLIRQSKFASMKGFGREEQGHIALQDHGDKVWFRNIKIREL